MDNATNKWQTDGDGTWLFGAADCEADAALAVVSPEWRATRCWGAGRPDCFVVIVAGKRLATARTCRDAKKLAAAALSK